MAGLASAAPGNDVGAAPLSEQMGILAPDDDVGAAPLSEQMGILGVHHVAVIVQSLERSMAFYHGEERSEPPRPVSWSRSLQSASSDPVHIWKYRPGCRV